MKSSLGDDPNGLGVRFALEVLPNRPEAVHDAPAQNHAPGDTTNRSPLARQQKAQHRRRQEKGRARLAEKRKTAPHACGRGAQVLAFRMERASVRLASGEEFLSATLQRL